MLVPVDTKATCVQVLRGSATPSEVSDVPFQKPRFPLARKRSRLLPTLAIVSKAALVGLRIHASIVKAPGKVRAELRATRVVVPLKVMAAPYRPLGVQVGLVAVALTALGDASAMVVPLPSLNA